jgi:hypothetical protein
MDQAGSGYDRWSLLSRHQANLNWTYHARRKEGVGTGDVLTVPTAIGTSRVPIPAIVIAAEVGGVGATHQL